MTIRSIPDAIDLCTPKTEETFSPTRYPYTYACDYLCSHPHIVPPEVYESNDDELWNVHDVTMSRAQASRVRKVWAALTGISDDQAAILLANAYLKAAGLRVSYSEKCAALGARGIDVDPDPERWAS